MVLLIFLPQENKNIIAIKKIYLPERRTTLMLSKSHIKFIKSLQIKKFRKEHGLFLVEGRKNIAELLQSGFETKMLAGTKSFIEEVGKTIKKQVEVYEIKQDVLDSITTLEHNEAGVAVVKVPTTNNLPTPDKNRLYLLLDGLQDPGNLGTIIRTADWFGLQTIFCTPNTVELYNPKVIAATMGSFLRVNVHYENAKFILETFKKQGIPVIGSVLKGKDLNTVTFRSGLLVVGNEGKGISDEILKQIDLPVTIPGYGDAESLNAAVATGIILYRVKVEGS